MNKVLLLVGIGLGGLGLLLHIIGLGTPEWVTLDSNDDVTVGLFKFCGLNIRGGTTCKDWDDPPSKIEATRAMTIMGMLAGGAGVLLMVVFLVLHFLGKNTSRILALLPAAACGVAFVFIIIGVIIFAAFYYDEDYDNHYSYGYSFALCIVGSLLIAAGGGVFMAGSR